MTIGAWSVVGNGTRAMVRSCCITESAPDRTLIGSSMVALRVSGTSPRGTGKVSSAVPWSP
jgi:hypothetical protein